MQPTRSTCRVLVIGAGIAGCTAALVMADQGVEVTMITSGPDISECNTSLAQGGIVYKAPEDSPKLLERDILVAGWNLNYPKAVRHLCRTGPKVVQDILLERLHIPFEQGQNECKLTKEGGHSLARILYCADFTGRALMERYIPAVTTHPNIRVLSGKTAVDLLSLHHHSTEMEYRYHLNNQCVGAYVLDEKTQEVETLMADFTVLATGGMGQIYLHTTNTDASIGAGLSMAHRAGAKILNSEFVQFHPTALFHRAPRKFLISEAVRGEGAHLLNGNGERFMARYDSRMELAPRDIVARAIVEEMLRTDDPCVYLDATAHLQEDIQYRFPTIFQKCMEIGIDPRLQPIPVVPAAHYFCGGVLVDLHGRTTLNGLYAGGECACTGVHGANRLASTSLLEGLLWGWSIGQDIAKQAKGPMKLNQKLQNAIPDWVSPGNDRNEDPALIAQDWATIRNTMWNYVGITRTTPRLQRAFEDLRGLNKRLHDFYRETPISKPLVDLFHGCQTAYLVTLAALRNPTSQGCHYRAD
ncbi:MAG: L-aspartate oxidase [Desulfovibrionales bacterium]